MNHHNNFLSLSLFFIVLALLTTSSSLVVHLITAEQNQNQHQNQNQIKDSNETICTRNFPKELVCKDILKAAQCGYSDPYICSTPWGYICLTEEQIKTKNYQCQYCLDSTACGTKQCDRICTKQQCDAAFSIGRVCPNPIGRDDPRDHFICTGGALENTCGLNNDATHGGDANCTNGDRCLVNNPLCSGCCDFNSCSKYESCFDKNCTQATCDEFYKRGSNMCAPILPFYCQSGRAVKGCTGRPHYFPETGCPDCCDLMNCFAFHCEKCPPEMCPSSSSSSSSSSTSKNIKNKNNKNQLPKKNEMMPLKEHQRRLDESNAAAVEACPSDFPVVCLESNVPGNVNRCATYGYWPLPMNAGQCNKCCSCE